jgi:hypothetical protein
MNTIEYGLTWTMLDNGGVDLGSTIRLCPLPANPAGGSGLEVDPLTSTTSPRAAALALSAIRGVCSMHTRLH